MNTPKPAVKRTKDQHYVPRLHLQHFRGLSPKNMIWTYSKSRGTARPSRIEETGFQKNYYSVIDEDGKYIDAIDKKLQEIESAASAPYQSLLRGELPTGQARADFAMFVATCFSRSPASIRSYAESYARMAHLQLRLNTSDKERFHHFIDGLENRKGEKVPDRDHLYEFINDPARYTIGISEKRGLRAISTADKIAPLLYDRQWNLMEAVNDHFITSDNPVCRWLHPDKVHPLYGDGGFKNAFAEVTFPLSASLMLVIGGGIARENRFHVGPEEIAFQNRVRAFNAEDCLFANCKDERLSALADEFKDDRPRMEIGMPEAQDVEVNVTR